MRRRVEIQGNQAFSPGTTARQIAARGASMLYKVHARQMVLEGVSGVRPNLKAKVRWTPSRGQPHMRDKSTMKGHTP